MAMKVTIMGRAKPLAFTANGKARLDVNANVAPRRKNRDTDQWEQQGDDLWVRGTLWGEDAERAAAAVEALGDGRVVLEGDLMQRSFDSRSGETRTSLELLWPRFVGVEPLRQPRAASQGTFTQPADDPWASQGRTETGVEAPNSPTQAQTPQADLWAAQTATQGFTEKAPF